MFSSSYKHCSMAWLWTNFQPDTKMNRCVHVSRYWLIHCSLWSSVLCCGGKNLEQSSISSDVISDIVYIRTKTKLTIFHCHFPARNIFPYWCTVTAMLLHLSLKIMIDWLIHWLNGIMEVRRCSGSNSVRASRQSWSTVRQFDYSTAVNLKSHPNTKNFLLDWQP